MKLRPVYKNKEFHSNENGVDWAYLSDYFRRNDDIYLTFICIIQEAVLNLLCKQAMDSKFFYIKAKMTSANYQNSHIRVSFNDY